VELLIFKYLRQNTSVATTLTGAVTFADRTTPLPIEHASLQLLSHETPDFIAPTLWPVNSPDLGPVDYQIWGKLQERVYRSRIHGVAQLRSPLSKIYFVNILARRSTDHRRSRQATAFAYSSLRSSVWKIFWTRTKYIWLLPRVDSSRSRVTSLNFPRLSQTSTNSTEIWWFVFNWMSHCQSSICLKPDVVWRSHNERPKAFGKGCTERPRTYNMWHTLHVPLPITSHSEAEPGSLSAFVTDKLTDRPCKHR